jgi:hypothetical protein
MIVGPPRTPGRSNPDSRTRAAAVVAVICALFAVVQRTRLAPFPHGADDFVGGLAVGLGLGAFIAWLSSRA